MKKNLLIAAFAAMLIPTAIFAQQPRIPQAAEPEYKFTVVKENPITSVKNQNSSGTCWCFSAISFLESEVIRIKGLKDAAQYPDLSEMFVVGQSYKDRAEKYIRLDGNLTFGAGSEADDVLDVIRDYGIVPQSAMPGKQALPIHGEIDAVTLAYVQAINKKPNRTLSENWKSGFDAIVDNFLGVPPTSFEVNGKTYTPASYRDELGIVPDDYVTITSFTHHPFYTKFAIEVCDNWRWDTAYNVPMDEMMQVLKEAVEKGYTAAWGADVSERGFSRTGVARLVETVAAIPQTDQQRLTGNGPAAGPRPSAQIPKEIVATQEYRQKGFDEQTTTDDHGMHIFGLAKDQEGTLYYMVKNSWGESGNYKGIYYASENYVAGKTIDIVVHKDALSKDMKKKLGIK
jgi:aminopeptidase C